MFPGPVLVSVVDAVHFQRCTRGFGPAKAVRPAEAVRATNNMTGNSQGMEDRVQKLLCNYGLLTTCLTLGAAQSMVVVQVQFYIEI